MRINYTIHPTLQHRTFVRIAIIFWNRYDIRTLLKEESVRYIIKTGSQRWSLKAHEKPMKWHLVVVAEVLKKVLDVSMANVLRKRLEDFIEAIGVEILNWGACHLNAVGIFVGDCLSRLCWTSRGTIDKKKTAKVLVRDGNLSVTDRYKLACYYCLEEDIHVLWNQLDTEFRKKYLQKSEDYEPTLISFWSRYMKGGVTELRNMMAHMPSMDPFVYNYKLPFVLDRDNRARQQQQQSFYGCFPGKPGLADNRARQLDNLNAGVRYSTPDVCGLHIAVYNGNRVSVSYFLYRMNPMVREEVIVAIAESAAVRRCTGYMIDENFPNEYHSDVFLFLLSIMNESQQMELFRKCPHATLTCLLDWPWQDFFVATATRLLSFLSENEYYHLLTTIYDKTYQNYRDYDYTELFRMLWIESSVSYKEYIYRKCANGFLFPCLFDADNVEMINLLLKDASVIQKKTLIFSNSGKDICIKLATVDKWSLLKFFLQKCLPSKDIVITFKEELENYIHSRFPIDSISKCEVQWPKIAKLIDDISYLEL